MRLTITTALALALLANLLPGCDRTATDREEAASKGATAPDGNATGQASEGSTSDRKEPSQPSSKY